MIRRAEWPAGLLVPLLALAIGSCTPASDSADRGRPVADSEPTRPERELPRAILDNTTVITLELALTPEEISQGLMYRPQLPDDRGMLFVFNVERVPSFWMKNTMIPLDLLFLDGQGTVVEIMENVQPCAAEPCPQYVPKQAAWAVLELAAGAAGRLGITEGDLMQFESVDGYPRDE